VAGRGRPWPVNPSRGIRESPNPVGPILRSVSQRTNETTVARANCPTSVALFLELFDPRSHFFCKMPVLALPDFLILDDDYVDFRRSFEPEGHSSEIPTERYRILGSCRRIVPDGAQVFC